MNEKTNLQDLTALLAKRSGITLKEAETFLKVCFESLGEVLINDKQLKIKDLGTFKLSEVSDRESVDVATGERVLIPAHNKVSFTADKNLAQIVNEPFAFFEPVELNSETTEATETTDGTDANPEETEKQPQQIPSEEKEKEKKKEEEKIETEIFEEEKTPRSKKRVWLISIILFLLVALSGAGMYYWSSLRKPAASTCSAPVITVETIAVDTEPENVPEPEPVELAQVEPKQVEPKQVEPTQVVKTEKSSKRTLTSGDRLTLIALREYGDKIFWIYLYEENKSLIPNPDKVNPGLTIVIPPAQKYGIDKNSPESVEKAKALIEAYRTH